jgi:hypothetical protein
MAAKPPAGCQLFDTPAHRLRANLLTAPKLFFPTCSLIDLDIQRPLQIPTTPEFNVASPAENSKWLPPRQVRHPEIDFLRSLEMMLPALPP